MGNYAEARIYAKQIREIRARLTAEQLTSEERERLELLIKDYAESYDDARDAMRGEP
jgi:hypothetical protein